MSTTARQLSLIDVVLDHVHFILGWPLKISSKRFEKINPIRVWMHVANLQRLPEDEVNPVMSALLDNGLEVTAIHNHFFFENPRMFYMHVHGQGKVADLARMAKPAIDLIGRGSPQHQSTVSGGSFLQLVLCPAALPN